MALSLIWENAFCPSTDQVFPQFRNERGLQHYSKAVFELKEALTVEGELLTEEALICNVLFFCLEVYQQNYESALSQMSCGLHLFCHWIQTTRRAATAEEPSREVDFHLMNLFPRMLAQSTLFIDTHLINWRIFDPAISVVAQPVPERFESFEAARDCFLGLIGAMVHQSISQRARGIDILSKNDLSPRPIFQLGYESLRRFSTAFRTLCNEITNPTSTQRNQQVTIDMMLLAMTVLQSASTDCDPEQAFDMHEATFEKITSLGSSIIDELEEKAGKQHRGMSFDIEVTPPLYFVAGRCRHPFIRREALRLLRAWPMQEGIWNSAMLACLAERIMSIEEEGSEPVQGSHEIPACARVALVKAVVDSRNRVIAATFSRRLGPEQTVMLREEIVRY